jgi:tetracycline 7-halogenase / FADH2 O2-dependent halogenase
MAGMREVPGIADRAPAHDESHADGSRGNRLQCVRGNRMNSRYDFAIVGSGFAGSLLAMITRRLGHSVVLLEKGTHPRVIIGESSTPLANLLFEELCTRYDLSALKPLAKWGSWQRAHPEIACGLKRGFTFHHHSLDGSHSCDRERRDQLLVAASPHNEIADTHWYRADFDHFLVKEAQKVGVDYFDRVALADFEDDGIEIRLRGVHEDDRFEVRAGFVVDATGPRGFLHRALKLPEIPLPDYPETQSLYSHFSGVGRLQEGAFSRIDEGPPYPIDDAAVHHVFDGGWIWVLQFNNGITSAGVAASGDFAARMRFADGAPAWQRIIDRIPGLRWQFEGARAERPFTYMPRLPFRSSTMAGERWALLPSAAGFVDPLLSTGFPLTLLGVTRLAEIIENHWAGEHLPERLRNYAAQTEKELLATAQLIGALYANMNRFDVFVALTLLYFAAASFAESVRRLGKPCLAPSFLLCSHPEFGPALERFCTRARRNLSAAEASELITDITAAIDPVNIAGLGRPGRRNWYPIDADDLLDAAPKLHSSRDEVRELLKRCGFVCTVAPDHAATV